MALQIDLACPPKAMALPPISRCSEYFTKLRSRKVISFYLILYLLVQLCDYLMGGNKNAFCFRPPGAPDPPVPPKAAESDGFASHFKVYGHSRDHLPAPQRGYYEYFMKPRHIYGREWEFEENVSGEITDKRLLQWRNDPKRVRLFVRRLLFILLFHSSKRNLHL